jgi:probable rRNA maturation factor
MGVRVNILDRHSAGRRSPLARAAIRALAQRCAPPAWRFAQVNVIIAGGAEVARLNRQFLRRHRTTDVLAFPMDEVRTTRARTRPLAGEVIVNADRAWAEARARGVAAGEELALYLVHGLLHLAGYRDHTIAERRRMYAREAQILRRMGWRYVR